MAITFNSINSWRKSYAIEWLRPAVSWGREKTFTMEIQELLFKNFNLMRHCEEHLYSGNAPSDILLVGVWEW